jgi:hypothetical protein
LDIKDDSLENTKKLGIFVKKEAIVKNRNLLDKIIDEV